MRPIDSPIDAVIPKFTLTGKRETFSRRLRGFLILAVPLPDSRIDIVAGSIMVQAIPNTTHNGPSQFKAFLAIAF